VSFLHLCILIYYWNWRFHGDKVAYLLFGLNNNMYLIKRREKRKEKKRKRKTLKPT
jgi:hypothetical protein